MISHQVEGFNTVQLKLCSEIVESAAWSALLISLDTGRVRQASQVNIVPYACQFATKFTSCVLMRQLLLLT